MDPKKFYKGTKNKSLEPLPAKFSVGIMKSTGGNMIRVGPDTLAPNLHSRRHRAKSLLSHLISSDQTWIKRRYREVQESHTSGGKGWYARSMQKTKLGRAI